MLRSQFFSSDGQHSESLSTEEMHEAISSKSGLLWVHLSQPSEQEVRSILNEVFSFHPLTIEDCLNDGYQSPKVDDFGAYLFLILHAVQSDHDFRQMETRELNIYLGDNYLVSLSLDNQLNAIDTVTQRVLRDDRIHQSGSDYLCHAILDTIVDEYFPVLDGMDDEIDRLEDLVLETPKPETLERILLLKHSVMALRRIISPQREVINRLSRDQFPQIDSHSQIYFRDIYDHLVRIQDMSESIRDLVSSVLDIYLSSTSLKLNNVMKALTIVSTIFLPITFLAGIYGMNFRYMPELSWRFGYPMVWIVSAFISIGMLIFFKKRGWF